MRRLLVSLLLISLCVGCTHTPPRNVVVWISIDGNRHDYVDRANPPLLTRLMHEGAYTRQLTPGFPSLTFAVHTSEVTGVDVDRHGIPGNSLFDVTTGKTYSFPEEASMIQAEPIWETAQRQGVRTAVACWPVSSFQTGPNRAEYFSTTKFDAKATDAQLVAPLLDAWAADRNPRPLRLLMGYMHQVDTVGHDKGPDSPEVLNALREDDAVLDHLLKESIALFEKKMNPQDELYFLVTTDHGMTTVHTQLNIERILGSTNTQAVHIVNSGPISNIFLNDVPSPDRSDRQASILQRLRSTPGVEAYVRSELPQQWHYNHPSRVGDIVAIASPGYNWEGLRTSTSQPAPKAGPRGMHGYPVEEDPDMCGFAVIWRYRHKLGGDNGGTGGGIGGGVDLGKVDAVQLEPTVAKILGIQPAAGVSAAPLDLR